MALSGQAASPACRRCIGRSYAPEARPRSTCSAPANLVPFSTMSHCRTLLLVAAALLAACLLAEPAAASAACDAAEASCQRQCSPLTPKFDCKEADGAISSSCACVGGGGDSAAAGSPGGQQAQPSGQTGSGKSGANLSGDKASNGAVPVMQVSTQCWLGATC